MTRSIKIAAGKLFPAVLSLALFALPSSLFAGGNATTYYSKLTVQRVGTGEGKIYAANAETSTPVYRMEPMTVTMSGSDNHEYYIYANAPVGTIFKGWSAAGATLKDSAALSTTAIISPSGTSAAEATPATITANFEEITYAAFSVKFSPPTTNGSYQVDGQDVSSAEIVRGAFTKVYRPALVATPDAGYAFYGWYESTDGGKTRKLLSRAATFSPSLTSNSIITAEFTVGAPAVTYEGLVSALGQNDITEIPEEATIFVPANEVLTILAGKSLLVNGKLILSGTINNQGDIGGSGTINLIKYEITQTGNGATPIVTETIRTSDQKKYYKTSVAAVSSSITGTAATCSLVNGTRVVRNGAEIAVAAYPIEATPVVFACKIDSSKALNHVTDFLSTPYYESVGKGMAAVKGKGATQMLILLADNKLIQNDAISSGIVITMGNYKKLDGNFGTMDLAGKKLTINTSYINSYSHTVLGGQLQVSTLMYSGTVTAINCSSVVFSKIKEDYASVINIYDLTGTGTTASRIVSGYNGSNAIKNAVNFYSSSTVSYTASQFLTKAATSYHIYGGKWSAKPDAKYIASIFAAEYEFHEVSDGAAKVWKLEEKNDKSVFEVEGGSKYETLEGGAAKLFEASDSVKIKLLRNAVLDEPITIPEGKTLEVELSGCCITAAKGFAINHGTLILGDEKANLSSTGGRIVTSSGNLIENDGTVDVTYGYYTGNVILKGGTFTTHHGYFAGSFSGDKQYADLRGGYFTKDVSSLLKDGYYRTNGYVGPFPMPTISKTWVTSNGGYWKYTFKTLPAVDLNLYNSTSNEKKAYTLENWVRRAEVRSMVEQYPPASYMVDIGVGFDRDVASGSASATVTKPVSITQALTNNVSAASLYRILSPHIVSQNSTQKKYSAFLSESTFQDAIFGIYGNNSVNNGTTANLRIDLCVGSNENPASKYALMSEYTVIGAGSNQAMIQPASGAATFYATISAAVSKVVEGGTIKLCNDITSTDTITISKACKIDTNGMTFKGKIAAGDGYYLKRETEVNLVEKMLGKSRTIYTIKKIGSEHITVKAVAKSQVYGEDATELSYEVEGLEEGDAGLSGALTRAPGSDVGTYVIQQGTLKHPYYSIDFVSASYTITPKTITVTAEPKTQVYGDEQTELDYSAEGLVGGDSLSGNPTREKGNDVGTYEIQQGTLTNSNYTINFVPAKYTITPKPITVTAADQTQVYGAGAVVLTWNAPGLVGEDTLTGELAREPGTAVGTYAISQGNLGNPNYTITLVPATYTITKKPITVTAADKSQVYGDEPVTLTWNTSGLVGWDMLTGELTRVPGTAVGTYAISQGNLTNPNYTITFVGATYTITKKRVTVTAADKSQIYGAEPTELTYTVDGLEAGDTLTGSLTREEGDNVGDYEIQLGSLVHPNYTIDFKPAIYTITPKTIKVTAADKTQVYGAEPTEFAYNVEGLVGDDALSGALAREEGDNVGTYEILQGELTAGDNYTIDFIPAKYTITPKPITVIADAKMQAYGAEEIPLTYKAVGLEEGDELEGELEREPGTEIGVYAINLGTLANPNYEIDFLPSDYEIVKKAIEISVNELAADAKPDDLDAAFRFVAGEEVEEYHDWEANFLVSFDRPVSKGSVVLAGTYSAPWGDYDWTKMQLEQNLGKNEEWKLLPSSGEGSVTYGDLIKIDQFDCGVKNLSAANVGTIMTVRLVISGNGKTIEIVAKTYELVVDIANHFEKAEYSIDEGESVEIKVCGGSTLRAVQTTVSLVKGTGTYSAAYMDGKKITLPRVLNWAKGDLEPKTIIFMTKASKKAEGDKFFTLQLGANVGEGIGESANIAKVTIRDIQEGETPRYVTALAYPAHAGTASGAGKLTKVGQIRTLTAKPKSFAKFGGWYKAKSENSCEIDFNAPIEPANPKKPMTIKVEEEGTYIAYFTDVLPIASSEISETEGVFVDGAIKAQVGVKFTLPISFSDDSGKGKLAAKGLPSGLKLVRDKKTREYSITGVPTKAGSFMATFTASNAAGKSTVKYAFEVEALPTVAIGTINDVIIEADAQIGTITFTVGKTGTISAKVKIGKKTYSFSTKGYDAAVDDKLIVTLPHKSGLMLSVSIDIASGEVAFDLIR